LARIRPHCIRACGNLDDETGMKRSIAFLAIAALAPLAFAQQQAARPQPDDPAARAPAAPYESAFAGYAPYREEKLAPWRDVNDEVGRIGGHVGLFRSGGQQSGPSRPAAGQPADSPLRQPAGEPPARGAPKAPQSGGHTGH
jgi:hypothetical protein